MFEITTVDGRKFLVNSQGEIREDRTRLLAIVSIWGIKCHPFSKLNDAWIERHRPFTYGDGRPRFRMRLEQGNLVVEYAHGIQNMRMLTPAKLAS